MGLCVLLHGDPLAPQQARLGAALGARGHRVVVCDAPKIARAIREEHGVRCEELRLPSRGPKPFRRWWARRLVLGLGIDVVHVNYVHPRHQLWTDMPGGPPYVVTAWGSDLNDEVFAKTPEHERAVSRVLARAAAITADSVPLLARARARGNPKPGVPVELVLWGVDIAAFDRAKVREDAARWRRELDAEGRRLLLSPRQTAPYYRADVILRGFAASRWAEDGVLVLKRHGKPNEDAFVRELEDLARTLGIAERVRFAPPCAYAELPGLYAAADAAVSAPDADGVPSTFCELMALGVPIVASDLPGYEGVLARDDNALLFAPGDPTALASQLDRLVAEPELASKLAESGRAWAHAHADWSRCVDRFEAMYEHATRTRRATHATA